MALKGVVATKLTPETEVKTAPAIVDQSAPFADDEDEGTVVAIPTVQEEAAQALQPVEHVPVKAAGTAVGKAVPNEADGFNDLDESIGYGSFPTVTLRGNVFDVDGKEYPSLLVQMIQSRIKKVYKNGGDSGDKKNMFFSTDGVTDGSGVSIQSRLAQWVSEGYPAVKHECREYREVMAKVMSTELEGSLVLLSISPKSVSRLSGYREELRILKKKTPTQVVTKLMPGNKVVTNGKTFYPWQFKFERVLAEGE